MRPGSGGGDWLASSWTAAGLASSLGRALGGSSPLAPPPGGAAEGSTPAADDPFAPLPPVDPDAEWDDDGGALDEIPVAEPAQLPLDAFDEAPEAPLPADDAPEPQPQPPPQPEAVPAPAPPEVLLAKAAERGSQPPPAAEAAPPGPATPPNEESAPWSSGLGAWDPTQLLPAEQREELAAAAASLRAGLPGGGNPAALLGTALLGTTDRSLRGFAGLMNNGRGGNTEAARAERS